MKKDNLVATVEEFLFRNGLELEDYFIEQTPVSEMLCYRNSAGREFDLPIIDSDLAAAVVVRLKALGVKVVRLGT